MASGIGGNREEYQAAGATDGNHEKRQAVGAVGGNYEEHQAAGAASGNPEEHQAAGVASGNPEEHQAVGAAAASTKRLSLRRPNGKASDGRLVPRVQRSGGSGDTCSTEDTGGAGEKGKRLRSRSRMRTRTLVGGGSSSSRTCEKGSFSTDHPHNVSFAPTARPKFIFNHAKQIRRMAFIAFSLMLINDACYNALGSTNGKFISLLDTVQNVMSVRTLLPLVPACTHVNNSGSRYITGLHGATLSRVLWVLLISFVIKFCSQTVLSLLLGETPVLFKGSRHILSFLVGFVLVWYSPGDVVFRSMTKSLSAKLLLSISSAVYRLRKALFALETGLALQGWPVEGSADAHWQSLYCAAFVGSIVLIALDGNNVVRKAIMSVEHRMANNQGCSSDRGWVLPTIPTLRGGLRAITSDYVIPDLIVAAALLLLDGKNFIELRIALLLYNCDKAGTFEILETIQTADMTTPIQHATSPQWADEVKKKKI